MRKEGPLASWAEVDVLGICGFHPDERPARQPTWEGPQPEFLRVAWCEDTGQ